MAQIYLTPEGKHQLSKMAEYQRLFKTAVLAEAREFIEGIFLAPVSTLREWKLDALHRGYLVDGTNLSNLPGRIDSHFVPYVDTQFIDVDDVDTTLITIKSELNIWFLQQAGVDPNDQTILGTKDSQTGAFIPA